MTRRDHRAASPSEARSWPQALRDLRRTCALAFGFSAVINVLMLTGSIYMLQVYDRVLSSGSVPTLIGLFAIVVVLHAFLGFFDWVRGRMLGLAAVRLDRAVGATAFRRGLRGGLPGGDAGGESGAGQPLRDLETVRNALLGPITPLFDAPWVPLFLGVLFLVHPVLGWLTVAGALVSALLALASHWAARSAMRRTLAREAAERDLAERSRRAAEAVLGMGMEDAVAARWQRLRDAALGAGQASGRVGEVLAPASRAFRMLLQSAVLTAGAWLVLAGEISGGMIVAATILSGRALAPVDQLIGNWRGLQRAAIAKRALDRALGEAPASAYVDLPAPEGRIEVANLARLVPEGAAGTGERKAILDGVSFALAPGDGLAVVGPSASGKSTLARLLVGLLPPDRGEVRLDGATLDQWEPARLGRHVGYLPQFPDLLGGTIRDVIARFDPATPDEAVIAAAKLAGVHEMILGLPRGYATEVGGVTGANLSGGQQQRVGLARAVCGMPRLLVLDEPNAHLDVAGDQALRRAIEALREAGSVVVVVTHRPSALAALNKVLVLVGGRVAQFGDSTDVLPERGPERRAERRVEREGDSAARDVQGPARAVPRRAAERRLEREAQREAQREAGVTSDAASGEPLPVLLLSDRLAAGRASEGVTLRSERRVVPFAGPVRPAT